MKWTREAEQAVGKVPFFVRRRVRLRVEKEARETGKSVVALEDVEATRKRFLTGMRSEVKGYQVDACFGPSGCPNRIGSDDSLVTNLESLLKKADIRGFLESKEITDLKFHHEFRVTVADCPNACSQPQIKDIGIIAACVPDVSSAPCSGCQACVEACREAAVSLDQEGERPVIDMQRCLACGQCISVCPTGTLEQSAKGYRIQLGGKLGRHPQLARELPGIYDHETICEMVQACIDLYKVRSRHGERLGSLLASDDIAELSGRFSQRRLA